MIGKNQESDFSLDNYEDFYSHHKFEPLAEDEYSEAHTLIPRFGWGFDTVEELEAKNLLDIGCLDGSFALTVARHHGIPVTGIDLTKDGVDLARERAARDGLPAEFHQGYAEEVLAEFAKEGRKFDVITAFEIIEHVKDVDLFLKRIDDVLAPGGHVLLSTPAFEDPLYGKDDEVNKCHIRLFTEAEADYQEANKFGTVRTATSFPALLGDRILEMGTYSHLINLLYK